jgi:hypothetical protein
VRYLPEIPDVSRIEGRSTWGEQILTLMALLWNAFIIPTFVFVIFMYLNDRSRMRTGQVLVGELLNARGYDDGDGGYMVMVEYQFQAPRVGRLHKESDEVLRNDLHKKPLPERGTPVLVWYKDWSNFDIL